MRETRARRDAERERLRRAQEARRAALEEARQREREAEARRREEARRGEALVQKEMGRLRRQMEEQKALEQRGRQKYVFTRVRHDLLQITAALEGGGGLFTAPLNEELSPVY